MEKMRTREEILKELKEVKKETVGQARIEHPGVLAAQAGANAPLMATALGSLLEVALDIREFVKELPTAFAVGSLIEAALDIRDLTEKCHTVLSTQMLQLDNLGTKVQALHDQIAFENFVGEEGEGGSREDMPVIEPGNEVDAEHLAKIFPPCPECGSGRVNGEITDETGRKRKCEACGHEWELEEVVSSGADD